MRAAALTLLLTFAPLLASCGPEGPEVVTGFHGYPWGTRAEDIAELAGSEPVARKEGLVVRSAEVTFHGRPALAGFYFHPETGELLEGAYVFALTLDDCESAFDEVVAAVADSFPTLRREEQIARREGRDVEVYENDCEFFVYNAHQEVWQVDLTNPGGPGDRAGVWLHVTGRAPRMTLYFRSARGEDWVREWGEDHEDEEVPPGLETAPPPLEPAIAPRA